MLARIKKIANFFNHPLFTSFLRKHHNRLLGRLERLDATFLSVAPWTVVLLVSNFAFLGVYGFYLPGQVDYSYESELCMPAVSLFPKNVESTPSASFSVKPKPMWSIGKMPMLSLSSCVTAHALPSTDIQEKVNMRQFGLPFSKTLTIHPRAYPETVPRLVSVDKLSTRANLVFDVSGGDTHALAYTLTASDNEVPCITQGATVVCKTSELGLAQGQEYDFVLKRVIGDTSDVAFTRKFVTVEPLSVVQTSIAADSIVYDKPSSLIIRFSKPLKSNDEPKFTKGPSKTPVDSRSVLSEDKTELTVSWDEALARGESFLLEIERATAVDGAYLEEPYLLPFTVSAGPKVMDISIGSHKVATDPRIFITFDQAILPTQDVSAIVSIDKVGTATTVDGNQLIIEFTKSLPRCTLFTLRISDALQSVHGVSGGNAYEHSARTICQVVGSIGTSVLGRSITSYSFGSGDTEILFVGTTHGNEASTKYLLDSWVSYLEEHPSAVPSGKRVVIISALNPDAFASGDRTNANNVDLNRNFPANNWKASVKMPDGNTLPEGGGATALSEPESSALANYVSSRRPRFTLTYHSWGGIVMGNGTADSFAVASRYADTVGYGDESGVNAGEVFIHDTTGAFEDWLHDKESMPALLIELNSHTGNEFWRHRQAMLDVLFL